MSARIFQPAKTAMQSGRAKTHSWVLEFEPNAPRTVEPLMGWTSSGDMRQQVRLTFETLEDAIAYAEKNGIPYSVKRARTRKVKAQAYADNFRFDRVGQWTH